MTVQALLGMTLIAVNIMSMGEIEMKKLSPETAEKLVEKLRSKNINDFMDYQETSDLKLDKFAAQQAAHHYALVRLEDVMRSVLRGDPIDKFFEGLL